MLINIGNNNKINTKYTYSYFNIDIVKKGDVYEK